RTFGSAGGAAATHAAAGLRDLFYLWLGYFHEVGESVVPGFVQVGLVRRGHDEAEIIRLALEGCSADKVLRLRRRVPDDDHRLIGVDHRLAARRSRTARWCGR